MSYVYDTNFSSNFSRLKQTVYPAPSNRVLWHDYGASGGLNDRVSRVERLADDNGGSLGDVLESYKYLGLSRVVQRKYDAYDYQNTGHKTGQSYINESGWGTWISDGENDPEFGYVDDAGLADPYNGLDRFGRVIEQSWTVDGASTPVRFYSYDADGNVLYAVHPLDFILDPPVSEVYHANGAHADSAYDKLGRPRQWSRGSTSATNGRIDTISSPIVSDSWSVSSGNYDRQSSPDRVAYQGLVPPGTQPAPDPAEQRADVFFQFDGFGRLATVDAAQLIESGGTWSYDPNHVDGRDYEYDALGRRILERNRGTNTNEQVSTYLFHDASGRVLEEKRRLLSSSNIKVREQYVWSDAATELMVLRDRDEDDNSSNGYFGGGGSLSGLEERLWVEQGPDGSVWQIWLMKQLVQGTILTFGEAEADTFLYTPEGDVTAIHGESLIPSTPHSRYDWDYLWRGMRAGSYPADDTFGTNTRYEGLLWDWQNRRSHDAKRGTPLGEDVHAYSSSSSEHIKWNHQQTQYPNAGTSGLWSKPTTYDIGGQLYDPGEVNDPDDPDAWDYAPLIGSTMRTASALNRGDYFSAVGYGFVAATDTVLVGSLAKLGAKLVSKAATKALARSGARALTQQVGGDVSVIAARLTRVADDAPRVTSLVLNELSGAVGESSAKRIARELGETVIESQYRQGAVMRGIDFISFTGRGRGAKLFLNSVKRYSGEVPIRKFSEFGLGKGSAAVRQRSLSNAMNAARRAIDAAPMDTLTRRTLINQLLRGGANVRVIGSAQTQVGADVLEVIGRRVSGIAGQGFVIP